MNVLCCHWVCLLVGSWLVAKLTSLPVSAMYLDSPRGQVNVPPSPKQTGAILGTLSFLTNCSGRAGVHSHHSMDHEWERVRTRVLHPSQASALTLHHQLNDARGRGRGAGKHSSRLYLPGGKHGSWAKMAMPPEVWDLKVLMKT